MVIGSLQLHCISRAAKQPDGHVLGCNLLCLACRISDRPVGLKQGLAVRTPPGDPVFGKPLSVFDLSVPDELVQLADGLL